MKAKVPRTYESYHVAQTKVVGIDVIPVRTNQMEKRSECSITIRHFWLKCVPSQCL